MIKRLAIVGVVMVTLGGCFSSGNEEEAAEPSSTTSTLATTTTTTVPEPWGEEAYEFFEALRYVVPDRIDLFYSPTVALEGPPMGESSLDDREDLEVALEQGVRSPEAERLFLSSDQAALIVENLFGGPWRGCGLVRLWTVGSFV